MSIHLCTCEKKQDTFKTLEQQARAVIAQQQAAAIAD